MKRQREGKETERQRGEEGIKKPERGERDRKTGEKDIEKVRLGSFVKSHLSFHGLFNGKVILIEEQHLTHSWGGG